MIILEIILKIIKMINKEINTSVYVKFSNTTYEYMKKYSEFVGSSVSDFIRQSVAERILKLGEINFKENKNE